MSNNAENSLWHPQRSELQHRGATLSAIRCGSGVPALFLHGVPDSAELWTQVLDSLQQDFACTAPDLPGFGQSTAFPDQSYSLAGYAQMVDRLIEAFDVPTPLTLVTHDWGAIIGLAWASENPDKVSGIVHASAPFHESYRWHAWARVWRTPVLGELAMGGIRSPFGWPILRQELRRGSRQLGDSHMRQVFERVRRAETHRTALKLYRSADPDKFAPHTASVHALMTNVPSHVLWGRDDPYLPVAQANLLGARTVQILEDTGHWVPSEAPQAVIEAVRGL